MNKTEKVKAFAELYGLINYYYENRDLPVDQNFDFYKEIEKLCEALDLDYNAFIQEFRLSTLN